MYIWLDDIRVIPKKIKDTEPEYKHTLSVNETELFIEECEAKGITNFTLDLDHDLGDYSWDGGDAYKLVIWLIETGRNTPNFVLKFHTANPVGRENMESLYKRYW